MLVEPHQVGTRLDAFLAEHAGSRSAAARMIDDGRVTVNGRVERSSYRVRSGDEIVPDAPERLAVSAALPEAIPLAVVYEDADIIVIDKPKGMVVHPAPGHYSGTLVNALLHHCNGLLSNSGDPVRPGIVHRIDKDTSGLLIAAKHDFAHRELSRQLADRSLSRTYEAVIVGAFRESNGTIALPIGRNPRDRKKMAVVRTGGRSAVTHWSLIAAFRGYSHLRCELDTGRTHQIRVHLAAQGHPVVGDSVYGSANNAFALDGQCLHARTLKLIHPRTGEPMTLEAPLPDYFARVLAALAQLSL